MKPFLLCFALLLVVPMAFLNSLDRQAFVGYYVGVISTWTAYVIATRPRDRRARREAVLRNLAS